MRALAIAVGLLAGLLAGCERTSALYCEKHPGGCDADAAVADACTTDDACVANANGMPYCLDLTTCVGCRTSADCAEPTATCDPGTHACRGCKADSECASTLCLDSGACAAVDQVAYIGGPTASGQVCTQLLPCPTIEAALALDPRPSYIRLVGDVSEPGTVTIDMATVVDILGSGFAIAFTNGGVGLDITDTATVGLHHVDVSHTNGSASSGDDCIFLEGTGPKLTVARATIHGCDGDGIDASAGTVVVTDSEIHDCRYGIEQLNDAVLTVAHSTLHTNRQYAIHVSVTGTPPPRTQIDSSVFAFNASATDSSGYTALDVTGSLAIKNSIIARNGSTAASAGGITLNATAPASVEFLTIADNITSVAGGKGMTCFGTVTSKVSDSIITGNTPSTSTLCPLTYSLTDATFAGTGNKMGLPMFYPGITSATDPHFYRIQVGSAAIDGADPASTITKDIDGDTRPAGMADMGADEYHP